jgi:conjugal transfer pilus assembly protein TraW
VLLFRYFNTLLKRKSQGDSDRFQEKNYEPSRYIVNTHSNIKNLCVSYTWKTFIGFTSKVLITFIITAFIAICLSTKSYSADLGVHGTTYPIQEKDLIEYIKDKLRAMEETGELQKVQKEMQKKTEERVRKPKPVEEITNATEYREYTYDPTFILDKNITDSTGKILFVKGTKVNPLDTLPFKKVLIFIDGDNSEQVEWALKRYKKLQANSLGEKVKIILTNGSPIDLMEETQIRFYFDQTGYLTKKLRIQHVPAIVQQAPFQEGKNKTILIKEIPMKEELKNNKQIKKDAK